MRNEGREERSEEREERNEGREDRNEGAGGTKEGPVCVGRVVPSQRTPWRTHSGQRSEREEVRDLNHCPRGPYPCCQGPPHRGRRYPMGGHQR